VLTALSQKWQRKWSSRDWSLPVKGKQKLLTQHGWPGYRCAHLSWSNSKSWSRARKRGIFCGGCHKAALTSKRLSDRCLGLDECLCQMYWKWFMLAKRWWMENSHIVRGGLKDGFWSYRTTVPPSVQQRKDADAAGLLHDGSMVIYKGEIKIMRAKLWFGG